MHILSTSLHPDFEPKTKEARLALELSQSLADTSNFACYMDLSKRYSESHLRRILGIVLKIDERSIKKTRGALFVYLVKHFKHP